ncbi:hypothetical protein ACLB2K_036643 [Fragaria x ananassa]
MPVADMLIDVVAGHEMLSFMDDTAGYHQIPVAEADRHKTIFQCPAFIGAFEYMVMPFGLKNAGATYQRAMNLIFHDILGKILEVYIDDVVVKSNVKQDHIADLKKVFERMRTHGLRMNPAKCVFGVQAGDFLSFVIHQRGIEVPGDKAKAVINAPAPKTKKELQQLLGKINFLRRFISNSTGREYLANPPVLVPPKPGIPLKLYILASESSVVGLLAQDNTNHKGPTVEQAIYYLSITLLDAETSTNNLSGAGISLVSPSGGRYSYSFQLEWRCTNNQAEYEAVIIGLEMLLDLRAQDVDILGDSLLVINQLRGKFHCINFTLVPFLERALELLDKFSIVSLEHIPRAQNFAANELAHIATGVSLADGVRERILKVEKRTLPSFMARKENNNEWFLALNYVLKGGELLRRGENGIDFLCVYGTEAKLIMREVHLGVCGSHQAGPKVRWLIRWHGFYWPTISFAKGRLECQAHGPVQHIHNIPMQPIIKPWPGRGWSLDFVGVIHPYSSQQHKFILVGTDFFTKWVEAEPVKEEISGIAETRKNWTKMEQIGVVEVLHVLSNF